MLGDAEYDDEDVKQLPKELPVHSERRAESNSDYPEEREQLHTGFR